MFDICLNLITMFMKFKNALQPFSPAFSYKWMLQVLGKLQ